MYSPLRLLLAVALFSAGTTLASHAQTANPKSDDIVKALTPSGGLSGPSRGIRMGNPPSSPNAPSAGSSVNASGSNNAGASAPSVNLSVQFQTGSADLTPGAMQTLNELGRALNQPALAGYRFRIAGHTDTVGSPDQNKELSDRRANAVADYLAAKYKVDRTRLDPVGMGEAGLMVATPPQTPEARNRRVEVINLGG